MFHITYSRRFESLLFIFYNSLVALNKYNIYNGREVGWGRNKVYFPPLNLTAPLLLSYLNESQASICRLVNTCIKIFLVFGTFYIWLHFSTVPDDLEAEIRKIMAWVCAKCHHRQKMCWCCLKRILLAWDYWAGSVASWQNVGATCVWPWLQLQHQDQNQYKAWDYLSGCHILTE